MVTLIRNRHNGVRAMSDIIERIKGLRYVHVPQASQLFEEAVAEIERLRLAVRRLAEQDATLSVCEGNVTVTMDATLTDEEREAVEWCVEMAALHATECDEELAALRGLLDRIKTV